MFETAHGTYTQRKLELLSKGQVKVSARLELKAACKKVLSATAKCFLAGHERGEGGEVRVSGKVVTRVIFLDEFDAFNSEEHTDSFTERLGFKGEAMSINPAAVVLETTVGENAGTSVEVDSVIDLIIVGLVEKGVKFVSGVTGQAETRTEKMRISTFERALSEKFSAVEMLELDKNCAGVLGVDCNASVRDVFAEDGRVTIKGTVSANVLTIKSGETATMHNAAHEFDFTKTIHVQGLSAEDTVFGGVVVAGVAVKADNKVKPELNVEVDLAFNGFVLSAREVEYVADAFSGENALNLATVSVEHTNALPQVNLVVDIEGNMTMPANSPFIARILTSSGARITGANIGCADGKVTVEGVVSATVVYECEEKQIHTHEASVAFSTFVRVDGINNNFNVQASVGVVSCYIKARRGKELMVDAKLAVLVSATETHVRELTAEIAVGEAKQRDDSAIVIVMPEAGETLWDIAKRISMPVADIVKQNPNCAQSITVGEKIFIYRQQVINF